MISPRQTPGAPQTAKEPSGTVEKETCFSVVLPTRNRPELLLRAVESVRGQTLAPLDVLVVDDGSDRATSERYQTLLEPFGDSVRYLHLAAWPRGRGPAYARNVGAWSARGDYLAFLDDDDEWTDSAYLAAAHRAIASRETAPDLLFANQVAVPVSGGEEKRLWLQALAGKLEERGENPREGGFEVAVGDLVHYNGFCHLNTTLVRREHFLAVGSFDEYLRYEEDLDFYIRAIDRARGLVHLPQVVSRHYIPDPQQADSASQSLHLAERLSYRRQLLGKNMLAAVRPEVRAYCRRHLAHTSKRMARAMVALGQPRRAYWCARDAAAAAASPRWLLYTAYLGVRLLFTREN